MIKELTELFKAYCKVVGLKESTANKVVFLLLLTGFCLTVIGTVWSWIKQMFLWRNQRILNRDLHPYYSPSDVTTCTKFYIPTKYQNVAPSEDDEPGRRYIASAKNKLTPLFSKRGFSVW